MKALILGLVLIGAALCAAIPAGLGWWGDILSFLRGALPVMAVFIGIIAIFVGVVDIRDRAQTQKEEDAEKPDRQ